MLSITDKQDGNTLSNGSFLELSAMDSIKSPSKSGLCVVLRIIGIVVLLAIGFVAFAKWDEYQRACEVRPETPGSARVRLSHPCSAAPSLSAAAHFDSRPTLVTLRPWKRTTPGQRPGGPKAISYQSDFGSNEVGIPVTQLSTIGATRCELHPIYVKENILCHQKQKSAKHPNNSTQH